MLDSFMNNKRSSGTDKNLSKFISQNVLDLTKFMKKEAHGSS